MTLISSILEHYATDFDSSLKYLVESEGCGTSGSVLEYIYGILSAASLNLDPATANPDIANKIINSGCIVEVS